MSRHHHALDDIQLRKWLANGEPLARSDGDGLTFTLSDFGTATWVLRYSRGARRRECTIGSYPDMSLSEARERARSLRVEIDKGNDPAADKKLEKSRLRHVMTVSAVCDEYVDKVLRYLASATNKVYRPLINGVLKPRLGSLDVTRVQPGDIVTTDRTRPEDYRGSHTRCAISRCAT